MSALPLKASEYKKAIENAAAVALADYPTDVEMRCRLFVASLAGALNFHDQELATSLREVYIAFPGVTVGSQP